MTNITIKDIVDRGMKQIAINHAKSRMEELQIPNRDNLLIEYEKLNNQTLWYVVTVLYGEPKINKISKEENEI